MVVRANIQFLKSSTIIFIVKNCYKFYQPKNEMKPQAASSTESHLWNKISKTSSESQIYKRKAKYELYNEIQSLTLLMQAFQPELPSTFCFHYDNQLDFHQVDLNQPHRVIYLYRSHYYSPPCKSNIGWIIHNGREWKIGIK